MESIEPTGVAALELVKDILGSQGALARVVGVKQPSVNHILRNSDKVPAEWCIPLDLETAAKGKRVSCHQLRPDLWPSDFVPSEAAA
jgi:DNA-binding transcriptional regulator YdaS (Cro superfamily)